MSTCNVVNLIFSSHKDHAAVNGIHYLISDVLVSKGCHILNVFLSGETDQGPFPGETERWKLPSRMVRRKGWKHFLFYHRIIKRLLNFLKKHQAELVICDGISCIQLMSHVQKTIGIPAIGILHGRVRFNMIQQQQITHQKDLWKFIAVSSPLKQHLMATTDFLDDHMLDVVPNAVDFSSVKSRLLPKEKARLQLGIPVNSYVFGVVGRLVPVKGHETVIEAVSILKKRNVWPSDALLVLIGNGKLKARLEELIDRKGLKSIVIMTGSLDNAACYMSAFDIFVMPSLKEEAFGIALLEACVAKLPVIASDISIFRAITGGHASYFTHNCVEQLAKKLEEMLDTSVEQRNQTGMQIHEHARKRFDVLVFREDFWKIAGKVIKICTIPDNNKALKLKKIS